MKSIVSILTLSACLASPGLTMEKPELPYKDLSPRSLATRIFWAQEGQSDIIAVEVAPAPRPSFTFDSVGNCHIKTNDGIERIVTRAQIASFLYEVITPQGDMWFIHFQDQKQREKFDLIQRLKKIKLALKTARRSLAWLTQLSGTCSFEEPLYPYGKNPRITEVTDESEVTDNQPQ